MRLLRLSLLLVGGFAVLLTSIHLLGGSQPNPVAVIFTNPDGSPCKMPCLLGVRPDEMSVEDAIRVLRAHPLLPNLHMERFYSGSDLAEVGVQLQLPGVIVYIANNANYGGTTNQIRFIALETNDQLGSPVSSAAEAGPLKASVTGDMLAAFGEPFSMGFSASGLDSRPTTVVGMTYPDQQMTFNSIMSNSAAAQRYGYTMNDSLSSIVVVRKGFPLAACKRWFGFVSLENYYAHVARSAEQC